MITTHKELVEALERSGDDLVKILHQGLAKRTSCLKCGKDFFSYKGTAVFCKICLEKIKSSPKLRAEITKMVNEKCEHQGERKRGICLECGAEV